MELRPGVSVDRYTLVEPLGQGGQGAVWKVVDPLKNALWALKLFDMTRVPETTALRARREAESVKHLQHPAIVPCHTLFEIPAEHILGLVFELVPGQPLSSLQGDPRLTVAHRLAVLEQLTSALHYVHERGVIHRDLKPSNLLLADTFWSAPRAPGSVRLIDFGIASLLDGARAITREGWVVGTKRYLAPEVLLPGRYPGVKEGTPRDMFALGVLAWELFLGEHPTGLSPDAPGPAYASAYGEALARRRPWPPFERTTDATAPLCALLALDPRERPASAATFWQQLRSGYRPSAPEVRISSPALDATTASRSIPTDLSRAAAPPAIPAPPPGMHPPGHARSRPLPEAPPRAAAPPFTSAAAQTLMPPSPTSTPGGYGGPRSSYGGSAQTVTTSAKLGASGRARAVWIGALLAAAAVAAVATFAVSFLSRRSEEPAFVGSSAPVLAPSPVLAEDPTAGVPAPTVCCGEKGSCSSGRACISGTCSAALPERSWWLRVTGVVDRTGSKPGDMADSHRSARVCMQRTTPGSAEVCAPLANVVAAGGDWEHRLQVKTSDLLHGRVTIRIKDGEAMVASDRIFPYSKGILSTALCGGLSLYVGATQAAPAIVYVYLDDR